MANYVARQYLPERGERMFSAFGRSAQERVLHFKAVLPDAPLTKLDLRAELRNHRCIIGNNDFRLRRLSRLVLIFHVFHSKTSNHQLNPATPLAVQMRLCPYYFKG